MHIWEENKKGHMDCGNMLWQGACQGGNPKSILLAMGEGSCLLCRFEAKALVSKE